MYKSNQMGFIGESRAITEFLKLGFSIYVPFSDGNDQFDFIAHKNDKLLKVEVKSTTYTDPRRRGNCYQVGLRSIRYKNRIRHFDPSKSDILAAYIQPLDVVCFVKSSDITNTTGITFRDNLSSSVYMKNHKQRLVSEYIDLEKVI